MKSITFILGFLVLISCAHVSTTSPPVNITGTWIGSPIISGMPMSFTFNFISDGESLKGNACESTNSPDEWVPLENGKIKGNKISFIGTPSRKKGIPKMTYRYEGEVEGDEIKLTWKVAHPGGLSLSSVSFPVDDLGMGGGSFTIKRVK